MISDYYQKFIWVTLLLVIHLFFNNYLYSSTQINLQNSDMTIDSLLLAGDISAVRVKYEHHEFEYYSSEELEALFRNVDFATTLDLNTIDDYVSQYKTLSGQYNIEYAGENAYIMYEKFSQLSNQIVKAEALKFYYISLFFKIHHIKTLLTSARNIYIEASKLLLEEKFNEALRTLNSIVIYSGQNVKLMAIEESLEMFRQDIFNQQIKYNRWHRTGLRTHKLYLGMILSVQYYGAVSDAMIKIENAVSAFLDMIEPSELNEIHISHLPATVRHELSLGINYLISGKWMIGLDVGYTALSMNSENKESAYEDQVFYDIKLRSYILKPYIKYLFSEEIGVSPFVNAGIGYQMIEYDDTIAGAFIWYTYPHTVGRHTDYGDVPKWENRVGVLCEIGAEFIPSTSSHLLYGLKVGGYYFFNQNSILNNYNINFSLYAGLIL